MEKKIHDVTITAFDESNPLVGYTDGDVVMIDNVRQLTELNPIRARLNFIIACTEGRLQLDVNGVRRSLEKNDVLFSCPGVVLDHYMVSPDFECKILCLSERIIQGLLHGHIKTWNQAVYVQRMNVVTLTDEYIRQFSFYHALIRQTMTMPERQFAKNVMQSLVQALLFDLSSILYEQVANGQNRQQTQGQQLFDRFLSMLSAEKVRRHPVSYYAERLAVTPKYLTMVCVEFSGKPTKDWINQYVMEDVRYCLQNTTLSMKEISNRLGFTNASHFGSYVRLHFGLSPSSLREGHGA